MGAVVEGEVDLLERDALEVGRAREREGAERSRALPASALFDEDVLDVVGSEGAETLRMDEGGEDLLAAEAIEEGEDAAQVAVEGDLGGDEALQVGGGGGAERGEAMHEGAPLAAALGVEEGFDVGGVDDVVAAAVVAGVARDLVGAEVDGDLGGGGLERQRAADEGRGHAVEVAAEGDAAERARAHGTHDAGVVGCGGERGEQRTLLGEHVDGPTIRRAVLADIGDLVEPDPDGAVGVLEGREGAAREEALLEVLGGVLDATLFVGAVGRAGDGPKAVVRGEVEEPRVEPHVGADVGQDHAAQVVVEDAAHDSPCGREGALVAGEEDFELLAERQLDVEEAAVAQDVEESGEASRLALDEEGPAGGPVDLSGVPGREGETEERLGRARGSQGGDEPLEHGVGAAVAEGFRLGLEPDRGKHGVTREEGTQRVLVGIEVGRARRSLGRLEAFLTQRLADRFRCDGELASDLALREVLAEVEATDLGPEGGVHHGLPCARRATTSRRTSPNRCMPPVRGAAAVLGSSSTW